MPNGVMMRKLLKPLWFIVAAIYLAQAWAYDHAAPLIKRLASAFPLERIKLWTARAIEPLHPFIVLIIFLVPLLIVEPPKVLALWFIAEGHFITGAVTFALAEIGGLAVIAFLFEPCKPKLMQIAAFAWCYTMLIRAKDWSLKQVEPGLRRFRVYRRLFRNWWRRHMPQSGLMRWLGTLRRKARSAPSV